MSYILPSDGDIFRVDEVEFLALKPISKKVKRMIARRYDKYVRFGWLWVFLPWLALSVTVFVLWQLSIIPYGPFTSVVLIIGVSATGLGILAFNTTIQEIHSNDKWLRRELLKGTYDRREFISSLEYLYVIVMNDKVREYSQDVSEDFRERMKMLFSVSWSHPIRFVYETLENDGGKATLAADIFTRAKLKLDAIEDLRRDAKNNEVDFLYNFVRLRDEVEREANQAIRRNNTIEASEQAGYLKVKSLFK
jgi:hypothetical protein